MSIPQSLLLRADEVAIARRSRPVALAAGGAQDAFPDA